MRFKKKPVEIEAFQWTGSNEEEVQDWITGITGTPGAYVFYSLDEEDRGDDPDITAVVYDKLHSTWMGVKDNQWIICGVELELYAIDPGVLLKTYDMVEDYKSISKMSVEAFIRNHNDS